MNKLHKILLHLKLLSGGQITNKGDYESEIVRRTSIAKEMLTRLNKIWKDSSINIKTKGKLLPDPRLLGGQSPA